MIRCGRSVSTILGLLIVLAFPVYTYAWTQCNPNSSYTFGLWASVDYNITWNPSDGTVVASNTMSMASGMAYWSRCDCPCVDPDNCNAFDADNDSDSSPGAVTSAGAATRYDSQYVIIAEGYAWTREPSRSPESPPEMWTDVALCWIPGYCCGEPLHYARGIGTPFATAVYPWEFIPNGRGGRTDAWAVTLSVEASSDTAAASEMEGIWRSVFLLSEQGSCSVAMALITVSEYADAIGLTYDSQSGNWIGQAVLTGGTGQYEHTVSRIAFNDESIDVDGDERFNQLDVNALGQPPFFGSDDPEYLARWDFDLSGQIDEADMDYLQGLVDVGLGSGVFGDLDGDGVVCPNDAQQMEVLSSEEPTLGDPSYVIAADHDLNGIIDEIDQQEFDTLYGGLPDCNLNSVPDACDLHSGTSVDCNLNSIPDECEDLSGGDFNRDGDVNLIDFASFVECLGGPDSPASPLEPQCLDTCLAAFDFDADDDVDLEDFSGFQKAFTE